MGESIITVQAATPTGPSGRRVLAIQSALQAGSSPRRRAHSGHHASTLLGSTTPRTDTEEYPAAGGRLLEEMGSKHFPDPIGPGAL